MGTWCFGDRPQKDKKINDKFEAPQGLQVMSYGGVESVRKAVRNQCSSLGACLFLEDTGHWCQQEKPDEVNAALLDFAKHHKERCSGVLGGSRL